MSSPYSPSSPNADDDIDPRYAQLVTEVQEKLIRAVALVQPPLKPEQHHSVMTAWAQDVYPTLQKHLDALVGPARPVIAEACQAFNEINFMGSREDAAKDFSVCKGETVAVVTRLGAPESPGQILRHIPGCQKHSLLAMSHLTAQSRLNRGYRAFDSIIPLADARREIRQQELAAPAPRPWWRRFGL